MSGTLRRRPCFHPHPSLFRSDRRGGRGVPAAARGGHPAGRAQYSSVRHLPESVTLAQLDNGLTVIVQENHVAPVATVRCYVKNTGGSYEGRYLGAGLSHVLEHTVAGGTTTHRSEKEIERIVNSLRRGDQRLHHQVHDRLLHRLPGPQHALTAVELVADSMQHVTFEPKEFERELQVVRRELADGEVDREQVLGKLLDETVYTPEPGPLSGDRLPGGPQPHQQAGDFRLLPRALRAQQPGVRGGGRREDAGRCWTQVARQWTGTPRGYETCVALPDEPEPARSPRGRTARWTARSTTWRWPGPR